MLNKPVNDPTFKLLGMFFNDEFKRHPAVSLILKNDALVFTSSRAAFFSPRQQSLINY
jgi:hypothetical protein